MELKSFVVLKQVDKKHQLKEDYVIVDSERRQIKIHDPYGGHAGFQRIPEQKPGTEFSFRYDRIIEGGTFQSPQLVYKEACEDSILNAINNYKNGVIIAYGQTKSGKSTTLFGNPKMMQTGLMQISVNKYFELLVQTPTGYSSRQPTAQQLYLSIFDINYETVRDFGKYFFNQQTQGINKDFDFTKINQDGTGEKEPELLENSNEALQVRNLSKIEIKSSDQFSKILQAEEEFRSQIDGRQKISSKKYHSIYVLQIKHKMSAQNSYLFFLKIAGSEKAVKSTHDQKRAQDQIIQNNSLFVLAKYIGALAKNDHSVSYHDSKVTKVLHGILSGEEKMAQVTFLGHVYPVEQNYEESLLTLQYMDRLKAYDATYKKVIFDGPMPEQVEAQERLMERIMQENKELKKKYEQLQQDEKDKFEELKKKLGLDYTVMQIIKAKPNTKEFAYTLLHQQADERSETLNKINQDQNRKLKNIQRKQEESVTSLSSFQKKCEQQLSLLEQKYSDLVHKHNETKQKIKSTVKEEMKDINEEISKMMYHGHILIEEKAHLIHDIKDEMKKTTEHYHKMSELQEMGQREAEIQYKQMLNDKQSEYKIQQKNLKDQYEHLIDTKDTELKKFLEDATKYTKSKKEEMRNSRMEVVEIFEIIKKQCQTIELVESGNFSGGILSFNIPKQDKPQYPERDEYPLQYSNNIVIILFSLYKSLEKTKTLVSTNQSKVYQQYTKQKVIQQEMNQSKFEDTFIQEMEQNLSQQKKQGNNSSTKTKPNYHDYQSSQNFASQEYDQYRKLRPQDVELMSLDQLKKVAKAMQQEIKRCNNTEPLNPSGIREQTLDNLIKEREKWKQLSINEQKKTTDAQEILDSQKRVIDRTSNNQQDFHKSQKNFNNTKQSQKSQGTVNSNFNTQRPGTSANKKSTTKIV